MAIFYKVIIFNIEFYNVKQAISKYLRFKNNCYFKKYSTLNLANNIKGYSNKEAFYTLK